MVRKQQSKGGEQVFVYEAGPCGFWIFREITALEQACMVVSPALVPRRAGDHVKTDRRDSERLASLARAEELEAIHVPDIRYVGKTSWTGAHRRWLSELKLPQPAQQIVFEEYVDAIAVATGRIERLTRAIETEVLTWRFAPVVAALQAMRGIQFVHAVTLVVELGEGRAPLPRASLSTVLLGVSIT